VRVIRFGPFDLDPQSGEFWKDHVRIKLPDQPLQVLLALLERPGEVVSREDLRHRLWSDDTFVVFDDGVNTAVKRLRDALGDSADAPEFVETLPRRGYRFVGTIAPAPAPEMETPGLPHGPRLDRRIAIWTGATAVAAILLAAASARWNWWQPATNEPVIHSIAVLPLDNLTGDPGQEYLADGLTDELTTNLAKISSLRVISRASVMPYRKPHVSVAAIGRALHVDTIVEGSITRSGDRVRIQAQLIDAAADRHLWAEHYEGDVRDVLTLQREVTAAIADRIQARLTARERTALAIARPVNPDAYRAYVVGRVHWSQRTPATLAQGIESFQHAVDIDPAYAPAYAGLADCYTALGYGSYLPPRTAFEPAKAAAVRALELDGDLADPHATLGYAKLYYDWDFVGAERELRLAIALSPSSVTAHDWYGVYLTAMGRFDEARAETRRAQQLDPLSVAINTDIGFVEYYSGSYAEAAKQLRATVDMNPSFPLAHLWLGRVFQAQKQDEAAIAEFKAAGKGLVDWPVALAALGHVYGSTGRRGEARQTLERLLALSTQRYVTPYAVALVHAGLGDQSAAFDSLEQAVADRSNWLVWLKLDPRLASLRSSPRFDALVRRVGPGTDDPP
jgi:TolB-like protein/DNA-binding winged helix-turn-helix (wHTH) protein/Tfp pilus assembly protein PilF